jgi:hypothetical protein
MRRLFVKGFVMGIEKGVNAGRHRKVMNAGRHREGVDRGVRKQV